MSSRTRRPAAMSTRARGTTRSEAQRPRRRRARRAPVARSACGRGARRRGPRRRPRTPTTVAPVTRSRRTSPRPSATAALRAMRRACRRACASARRRSRSSPSAAISALPARVSTSSAVSAPRDSACCATDLLGDRHGQRGHGDPADEQPDGQDEARGRRTMAASATDSGPRDQRDERRLEPAQVEVLQRVDIRDEAREQISAARVLQLGRRQRLDRLVDPSPRTPEGAQRHVVRGETLEVARDRAARGRRSGRPRSRPSARAPRAAPRLSRSDIPTWPSGRRRRRSSTRPTRRRRQPRAAHLRDRISLRTVAVMAPPRAPRRPAVERDDTVDVLDELGPVRDQQHHPP